jgi:hypothetical protein
MYIVGAKKTEGDTTPTFEDLVLLPSIGPVPLNDIRVEPAENASFLSCPEPVLVN